MKTPILFPSVIVIALALLVAGQGAAHARTPTPTPTSAPPATATPVPPQPASFGIETWVNGQNTAHDVTAKIGETICATSPAIVGPGTRPGFSLKVPSEQALPGCGRDGAVVTFFVDGRQAPQTAIWHSGTSQALNIIIGPPFARSIVVNDGRIVPYIGDKPCGNFEVAYSNEQEPGCGVEGSQITFKLLDAQGNVIAVANEKATWHAWDGISKPQLLRLTFEPAGGITVGSMGTGGPQRGGWPPQATLALAGLTALGVGAALRKRAIAR